MKNKPTKYECIKNGKLTYLYNPTKQELKECETYKQVKLIN